MSKNYIEDTFNVLIGSENLKRLLWYPPADILTNIPDPLSLELPNISDDENINWKVIEDRILLTSKSDDLANEPKCRVYLYLGNRRPSSDNMLMVKQEIIIDVLWHELFDNDLRFDAVSKTLNRLLLNKRITGVGKMTYYNGDNINAPQNYQGYRHIYQVGSRKK